MSNNIPHPERLAAPSPAASEPVLLDRPRLIFATDLEADSLLSMINAPGVLDMLAAQGYEVALALPRLDSSRAQVTRMLNERGIPVTAWLLPPPDEGVAFNLQNYPQATACYHAFQQWVRAHDLRFAAVGLDIEPPLAEIARWGLRAIAHRLWLARENVLYPSAHAAYVELIAAARYDGYEVHTFQTPFIADDRRAGTMIVQHALDIVDLPADVDVLICPSSVPIDWLDSDLGGALIASYGPSADAIGITVVSSAVAKEQDLALLSWPALRRDLLLAAQYTDTIYVFGLEDCVERGLLERLALLDWGSPARAGRVRRTLVTALRAALLSLLLVGRFGPTILAWAGWALAAFLWFRDRRKGR